MASLRMPAILWLCVGVSLAAQQPPATRPPESERQPAVTFKVEVDYVEIDAVVTDARGTFVRNLAKEDFEVLEDGKPQTVTAFTLVDLPVDRTDPPLFRAAPIEPDVASNRQDLNGRIFVLVLDDLQTAFHRSQRVIAAAKQFVRRHVGANDLVAVVATSGRSTLSQELTTSQARLLAAISAFSGQKIPTSSSDQERASRARGTYDSLRALAEYLGGVRGRRKAIVWFGEGIEYEMTNPFAAPSADIVRQQMLDVVAAATRANVSFYSIDPRGIAAGLDEAIEIEGRPDDNGGMVEVQDRLRRAQDSLRTVAAETGGFAAVNQTNLTEAFSRIIRENSSYYVLGYYASDGRRDGRFRPVQVRVRRPGLEVRARKGYTAPRGRPASGERSLKVDASAPLREALNSPIPATGLGMGVFAAPFTGPSGKASVSVVVEFDPGQLTFVEKDGIFLNEIELVAIAIDSSGRIRDGGRDEVPMKLSRSTYDAVRQAGVRLTRRFALSPGRYQIRVAARESNSPALGAVSLDLDVPDFSKGPLQMSGVTLTSGFASRTPTANPDPEYRDVLPASPSARREFPAGDTLSLFTEVYDDQRAPHRVAIRTTLTGDDGRVVFTSADERRSEELAGSRGGGFGHTATVPLAGLPPGRYVLRVEAQTLLAGGPVASRELELRIR